jgi:hypothetical protein
MPHTSSMKEQGEGRGVETEEEETVLQMGKRQGKKGAEGSEQRCET